MDNDKVIDILSNRVNDLGRSQAIMCANNNVNNQIIFETINKQAKTIKSLRTSISILGLLGAVSGILYLSHELKQDKKLENLHKSDLNMCPKMCILHKSEIENDDILDIDDLK